MDFLGVKIPLGPSCVGPVGGVTVVVSALAPCKVGDVAVLGAVACVDAMGLDGLVMVDVLVEHLGGWYEVSHVRLARGSVAWTFHNMFCWAI